MEISHDEIRAQVQRLLTDPVFATAETQRRLLRYLAEKSLSSDSAPLKEYTVGVEALGKPESYNPQKDAIARIQASRLRQKLTAYYADAGRTDPIIVDLPKGQFKLTFALQTQETELPPALSPEDSRWRYIALALAIALFASVVWALYATRALSFRAAAVSARETWSSELEELWKPFLEGDRLQNRRPLLVSTGVALFIRMVGIGFVRLSDIDVWAETSQSETVRSLLANLRNPRTVPWTNFVSVGEGAAAFHIGRLMGARHRDVIFTNSAALSWADAAQHDIIFIGPPKFKPHVSIPHLMANAEYVLENYGVRNLRPQSGEPAFFADSPPGSTVLNGASYVLLSRVPGTGEGSEVLSFEGNWGPETLAGAQYFTEPGLAAELAKRIRLPSGALPPHYQAVIRVQFKNMTPIGSSIVSHRVCCRDLELPRRDR